MPVRRTCASATPRKAPASRSSSRDGRRCSLSSARASRQGEGVALALRFLGANRNVAIRGERPAPGRVNYLLGNDPSKWHTGLRTYERVVYRNLWPGVDMVFAGQGGKLKYEFLVRPGARVRDIRLAYRGAKRALARPAREPAHPHAARRPHRHAPAQLPARRRQAGARREAASRSSRRGAGYGFALGRGYDRRYPLVIDPGLVYSTYLGGGERRRGDEHRGRRRRQRLRDRVRRSRRTSRRPRAPSTRPSTAAARRLRDEARRERRRPRLLDLPGRKRRRPRLRHRGRRQPAAPT